MITMVATSKGTEAITSDRWHVVHSRLVTGPAGMIFQRTVHSEHEDRSSCLEAGRALLASIRTHSRSVPLAQRDHVFVRRPHFKTIASSKRRLVAPRGGNEGSS